MQRHINLLPGQPCVMASEIQERINCCGRVRIQERLPQSGLAHFANGQVLSFVPGIAETHFPVPRLEVIADIPHFATQPDIEELVPVSEFFASWTRIVNPAEPNAGSYRETRAIRKEIWNSRICNGERIKRIRDRHTDAGGTKECIGAWSLKWIRRKRRSRQRRIEIRARILEVGKDRQVFFANVAGKRAVVHLAISRRQRRRESGEVKEEVVATPLDVRVRTDGLGRKSRNGKGVLIKWRSCPVRS